MRYVMTMRTTLDLAEDVLLAAKDMSKREHKPMGQVISEMARKSFQPEGKILVRNGVPLFPYSGKGEIVTMELVNRLRDEAP